MFHYYFSIKKVMKQDKEGKNKNDKRGMVEGKKKRNRTVRMLQLLLGKILINQMYNCGEKKQEKKNQKTYQINHT